MPKIRLFAAVIIGLIAVSSFAATRTWTGVTNANWSEATNWSPTGVPNTNDTLAFDTVFQHADMNNDLPLGTRIGAISFTGSPHCSVSGNPLVLAGPVTGDAFIRWAVDLKMDTDLALPGIGFTGIDVNGHSVVIRSLRTKPFGFPPASIDGLITGSGTLTFDGIPAKINKSGDFRGAVYMNSDLVLAGSMPEAEFVIGTFRTLSGEGTIGSVSGEGGISPAIGPSIAYGTLRTKSLSLGGPYEVNVAFGYVADKLEVTGSVNLSGSLFPVLFVPLTPPAAGNEAVIIDNDGADAVIGTFKDLPEGALISASGFTMRISYHGGDGNDVTLTNLAYGKIWIGAGCATNHWSDACNWFPASVPKPGEMLDFGATKLLVNPDNDLPAGFAVGGITLNDCHLDGNPITLMGNITAGPLDSVVAMPLILGADVHIRCPYIATIDVNGHTPVFEGLTQIGQLNGNGTISSGILMVASGTFAGTLSGTLMLVSLPHANVTGVTHLSSYTSHMDVADISIAEGGTIDPGPQESQNVLPIGTITSTSLSLAGTYHWDVSGNAADVIIVNGPISLSGPLEIGLHKGGQTASSFTLIDNRGSAPVSGTFGGLLEGATVQAGSSTFTITYRGGDGNDVVLVSEPPPAVALSQSVAETVFGEPFTIRASVSGRGSVVTFNDDSVLLGSATPSVGVVAMDLANLGIGTHQITATFGTATAAMTHIVKRGSAAVTVTGSVGVGQVVAVKVFIQPVAPAAGGPGGAVIIEVDGATIGSAPVASGTATIITSPLPAGRHTIAAHYAGDASFEPGSGSTEVIIVPARGRSVRH